jgi:hypothetical protein
MNETAKTELAALRGQSAPADIVNDLGRFAALPEAARANLYEILGPCLAEPVPSDVEARLSRFCAAHGGKAEDIAHVVKGARFLLRSASAIDLDPEAFADDLASLPGAPELGVSLLAGYAEAKNQIRSEMLRGSILDHGMLLEGVDWRIDTINASDRAEGMRYAVGVLTLRYQDGAKHERITLQVLPEVLHQLRAICERMVG